VKSFTQFIGSIFSKKSPAPVHPSYQKREFGTEDAVAEYKDESMPLNHYLHSKHNDPSIHNEKMQKWHDLLKSHIATQTLDKDHTLYSGIRFHPHEKMSEDGSIKLHLPAFTSTSRHLPTAAQFSGIHKETNTRNILAIKAPAGSHALHMGDHEEEDEHVLAAGSRLHINPEPTVHPKPDKHGRQVNIWHAELVHDGIDK
jgi:hypothetical protein